VNWCVDLLKLLVTGWIVIPLFWAIVTLIARYPRRWWVFATAIVAPVLLVTIVLEPVLLSPLFNSYRPLSAGPLRSTILGLAARAGIRSAEVLVEDTSRRTSHVNAYVTGLGPSARIILNDTAIRQLPEDQLLAMVGHEMGHYVEGHIWVGFWSGCIGIATLFWFGCRLLPAAARSFGASRGNIKGMTDIAAIPLLLLFLNLFLLVQDPVANGISRSLEHRADAFGMRLTHLNEATARLMIGFAERDYSDPDPPALYQFWFGTHPSLSERIRFALSQDRDPATREPTPPR
jgi:Zn-dependent protease with chaperone function